MQTAPTCGEWGKWFCRGFWAECGEKQMKRIHEIGCAVALTAFWGAGLPASAQDAVQMKQMQDTMAAVKAKLANATVLSVQGGLMQSIPGAPYSAEQVTSSTQMLGDGTRIHNESRMKVYRDGKGRLRQETPDTITIFDPTTGVGYTLNPATMTYGTIHLSVSGGGGNAAYSYNTMYTGPVGKGVQVFSGSGSGSGSSAAEAKATARADKASAEFALTLGDPATPLTDDEKAARDKAYVAGLKAGAGSGGGAGAGVGTGAGVSSDSNQTIQYFFNSSVNGPKIAVEKATMMMSKPEDLGTRTIEGVNAQGERRTHTIESGDIGNDRPIVIMDEHWYSPDLHVEVKSMHSDPRTGEDDTDLINIVRGEPDPSLFQLPAGYQPSPKPIPFRFRQ